MRVLLIHNPKAGDGKHSKRQLIAMLTRAGHQVLYESTRKRGWKKALEKPVDVVIAAGGDGTVQKIAGEIMDSGIRLAILPLGTANNVAFSLGFTAPIDQIVQALDGGKTEPFDIGAIRSSSRTKYFLEAAGGGLFADYFPVAKARQNKPALPEDQLTADMSLLRKLAFDYPARHWAMSVDGEDISGRYIFWGAMNIRSAGPALRLAREASTDDGRLDFVAVCEKDRDVFLEYLASHLAKKASRFRLRARRFSELQITQRAAAIHFDGKQWPRKKYKTKTRGRIEIRVRPGALMIWRPALRA